MLDVFLNEHDLYGMLAPKGVRIPYPKSTDRSAWAAVAEKHRCPIMSAAQEGRGQPYPMVLASQFLAFTRDGSRDAWEIPYFTRRNKLMTAALAECLQNDGTYLDDIVDGLWCICEESFWGVSAHNGSSHPGTRPAQERRLPDVQNPYIDLFAAQTAATLSLVCYLLSDALDGVSPLIRRRVRQEIERRIAAPFFHHDDFWWMGMIRKDVNNWTPWILSNIMETLVIWEEDDRRLAEGLARGMRMLDAYLAVMPEDGGCDEGAAYWNLAGGMLLDCLELLRQVTGGRVDFYKERHIQEIGLFILRAHINGPYYWNFADCDAKPRLDGERIYTYGTRIGNTAMGALGAKIEAERKTPLPQDTPEMNRVLDRLFTPIDAEPVLGEGARFVVLPCLQVWAKEKGGMYVSIKGGHNGENHNHNDVGSCLIYVDGEPELIDVGNMVYTAKTFDDDYRYALFNTRSRNHNLPLIGNWEQEKGAERAAHSVHMNEKGVRMDIAAAYPAAVKTLERELSWPNALTLRDTIELASAQPITWVFMLRNAPALEKGMARAGKLAIRFDKALEATCQEIPVTDRRMAKNFPGSIYRLTLSAPAGLRHVQVFEFERSNP